MIDIIRNELTILSEFIRSKYVSKYANNVYDMSKTIFVESFHNALYEFYSLIKHGYYKDVKQKFYNTFSYENFIHYREYNPFKLAKQIEMLSITIRDGDHIPKRYGDITIKLSNKELWYDIRDEYIEKYSKYNIFISKDELELLTNYKFSYEILKGLQELYSWMISEYFIYLGPNSNRVGVPVRSTYEEWIIQLWFSINAYRQRKIFDVIRSLEDLISEYDFNISEDNATEK